MKIKHKKIVIFGGSFNPPHIGHMATMEYILRHFKCDEIWLLVSPDRADKKIGVSGKDRMKMLKMCINDFFPPTSLKLRGPSKPKIIISDFELKNSGLATTYDTKLKLESVYPNNKFYFLIGSDLIPDIETKWVKGKELWNTANFLAIHRSGYVPPSKLPKNFELIGGDLLWIEVSSTAIKNILKEGHSGIPYVHPKVARYINQKGLYK